MSRTMEPRSLEPAPMRSAQLSAAAGPIQASVMSGLLLMGFWPILVSMYGSWFDEHASMEHGILVAPAVAYMVWTERRKLTGIPRQPSAWGVFLVLFGAIQALLGIAAQWIWVSRTAFLVSLVGSIASLYGLRTVRALAYPLCTLILMIAPPSFVYERLTLSLQLLASRLGEISLEAAGYSVVREGNILEMVGTKLSVVEACSGIRSLLSILFMCTLYNYFFVRGTLMKTSILVMAAPVAILGNAGRIFATGIAGQHNRELVHGAAHDAFGYVSVIVAAAGCIALHLI